MAEPKAGAAKGPAKTRAAKSPAAAAKPAAKAAAKPAAKAAAKPAAPKPPPAAPAAPTVTVKAKAFAERVVAASGAKKKLVKSVLDAALTALREALAKGEELILPPLGKLRVNKTGAKGALTVKVKPSKPKAPRPPAAAKPAKARKPAAKAPKQALAGDDDSD